MSLTVKVDLSKLDVATMQILNKYSSLISGELEDALEPVAEWGVEELKRGGPYTERTGKYTQDWAYRENQVRQWAAGTPTYTIFNQKNYRLTHLLENGHLQVTKTGRVTGHVRAYTHIAPVEAQLSNKATFAVQQACDMAARKL